MEHYFVEGLITRSGSKNGAEAVSVGVWANSAAEAVREAKRKLGRVNWVEGPSVTSQSEEQRMRAMGAPELFPYLSTPKKTGK